METGMSRSSRGQLWLVPVLLAVPLLVSAQCPAGLPGLVNDPDIAKRWMELCEAAASNVLGDPQSPTRVHLASGGRYQDFKNGKIAVYPRWAGDPAATMPSFVLSAHDVQSGKVHVQWDSTAPYSYDHFLVRWDSDDHDEGKLAQHEHVGGFLGFGSTDPQQIEVEGGPTSGTAVIQARGPGAVLIYVEGCIDGDGCPQGWSYPVEMDLGHDGPLAGYAGHFFTFDKPPTLPLPPSLDPSDSPPFDMLDGPILDPSITNQIVENQCFNPFDLIEPESSKHAGELISGRAEAVMMAIRSSDIVCRDRNGRIYDRSELRDILNDHIQKAGVVSVPGTDIGDDGRLWFGVGFGVVLGGLLGTILGFLTGPIGPLAGALLGASIGAIVGLAAPPKPADYDMRLQGIIRVAYHGEAWWGNPNNQEKILLDDTRTHLREVLLTVRGGADRRRDGLHLYGLPTGIPESENHILMTESARFLTNQLIAASYVADGKPVPEEYDNDQNGMTDWFLGHLQSFVQNDFYEYNARPYTREAMEGISNLFEFAGPLPGSCWRSNPSNQPPSPRSCDVRRGARIVMDYQAARFALGSLGLRRASPNRRQVSQQNYSRLMGRQSDSMTWRYLVLAGGGEVFWDHRHGRLATNFAGNLLPPLSGRYRVPSMIASMINDNNDGYLQRFYFDRGEHPGVEVYYRHPDYLISAGGVHDDGRMGWLVDTEDAWARPTTLMPKRGGLDYMDFVRISGQIDDEKRANTCVGPTFACGLNPEVPAGIPDACVRRNGQWIFIDFDKNSPGCDLDYGYYVVFYRAVCDDEECRDQAGDNGTFGFFQVTNHRVGLAQLEQDILAANQGVMFRSRSSNSYRDVDGRIFTFRPLPDDKFTSGFISLQQGALVQTYDTDIKSWPLARGERMRSVGPRGCIEIDNPLVDQRLILDYSDASEPRRTRLKLSAVARNCTCPLPDSCLAPRYE